MPRYDVSNMIVFAGLCSLAFGLIGYYVGKAKASTEYWKELNKIKMEFPKQVREKTERAIGERYSELLTVLKTIGALDVDTDSPRTLLGIVRDAARKVLRDVS